MSVKRGFQSALWGIALMVLSTPSALAARQALVIGNDSYRHVPELKNARADADAVARALEAADFKVTLKRDLNRSEMRTVLRNFKRGVARDDEVVFFYAGHAVQIGGQNYLLPTDIRSEEEDQVKDDAEPLHRVLEDLNEQRTRFALAIIDACRDNPFAGTGRSVGGRGLASVGAVKGQMVIYSAGSNQQALDRLSERDNAPNSVFTRVLLEELKTSRLPVDQMLKKVRTEVSRLAKSTGRDQVPAIYDESVGDFYIGQRPKIDKQIESLLKQSRQAYEAGQGERLIELSQQILALDAKEHSALNNLAAGYLMTGKHDRAIDTAEQILKTYPNYAAAYNIRGVALEQLTKLADAQQNFRQACQLGHALSCRNAERLAAVR